MKAYAARHEKHASVPLAAVVCLFLVAASLAALAVIRLYGLYYEQQLAMISAKMEEISRSNAELEERYSKLQSPSRIYRYARAELNMVVAKNVETITMMGIPHEGISLAEAQTPSFEYEAPSFFDFFLSYVGVANAQD